MRRGGAAVRRTVSVLVLRILPRPKTDMRGEEMKKAVLKLRKNSGAHIAAAVLGGVAVFLLLLNIVSVDGTTQSIFLVGFRRFLYFMEKRVGICGVCRDRFVGVAAALFNFADCGPNFGREILPRLRCTLRNFSRLLLWRILFGAPFGRRKRALFSCCFLSTSRWACPFC